MFNLHTSMTATNKEIIRLTTKNVELNKKNEELEVIDIHTETLKQEVECLK